MYPRVVVVAGVALSLAGCVGGSPHEAVKTHKPSADILKKCNDYGARVHARVEAQPKLILGPFSAVSALTRADRFRDLAVQRCIENKGQIPKGA